MMGLFSKSKQDTQRMLSKPKGKTLIPALQLKTSSSSCSCNDDESIKNSKNQVHSDEDGTRKKKFWRVLQEKDHLTQQDIYIPPPGIQSLHFPVDPFATTSSVQGVETKPTQMDMASRNIAMPPNAYGETSAATNASTTTTKRMYTNEKFLRLDSIDDASYENIQHTVQLSKKEQSRSQRLAVVSSSISSEKNASMIHMSLKLSSKTKKRNHLSKHTVHKTKSSFSKLNNIPTPRSNGEVSYHPPNFECIRPNALTTQETTRDQSCLNGITIDPPSSKTTVTSHENTSTDRSSKHGFLLDVIRYSSSGEEIFDIRSENSSCGMNDSSTNRMQKENGPSQRVNFHRCGSIGSDSDVYSESVQSELYSDSGFPVTTTKPQSFQQILFDESFHKITAVSKSDTGSNTATYSELAKAATQLTKVLSPEPKQVQYQPSRIIPPPPPLPPAQARTDRQNSANYNDTSCASLGKNDEMENTIFSQGSIAPKSLPSRQNSNFCTASTSKNGTTSQTQTWKNSATVTDDACTTNRSTDGRSVTSNQSSTQRSRRDYQDAIRAKARSPVKKKVYSNKLNHFTKTTSSSGMLVEATNGNLGFNSPVSIANATFSNSVRSSSCKSSELPIQRKVNINHLTPSTDPFVMASDFNVTNFSTEENEDDDDPFHIGMNVVDSDDSAWNVHANPFQNNGSNSSNISKDSYSAYHRQYVFENPVTKATSMDDGLIESIRKASMRQMSTSQRGIDPENEENCSNVVDPNDLQRDPSPQVVRPSHSDSVLDYAACPTSSMFVGSAYGNNVTISVSQQQLKKKHITKAVPANAIIGSMLFRQTESSCPEEHNDNNMSKEKSNTGFPNKHKPRKEPPRSGHVDEEYAYTKGNDPKVPRAVHADHTAKSDVSSVTEEASTFYTKNLMHHSAKWNQSALNILNQYNVRKKTLQTRDTNAFTHHHSSERGQQHQPVTSPH
jgi:hypothetical protein